MTPSRTSALVEMVDLMPTLLELAQIHIHDASELEGVSLVPLLGLDSRSGGSNVHRRAEQQVADKERDHVWKNATFTQYPRCCGPHGTHLPCSASNTFNDGNQCTQTNASQFYAMVRIHILVKCRINQYRIRYRSEWQCVVEQHVQCVGV
eukprot:COSAG02_NODE_299_length_25349_cov_53.762020_15_plen_150_part_00